MSAPENCTIARWGPFRFVAIMHDTRAGWVCRVETDTSSTYVDLRTSPKGHSGVEVVSQDDDEGDEVCIFERGRDGVVHYYGEPVTEEVTP